MKSLETFEFLLGLWRVERLIEDHRIGSEGTFDGMATLAEYERSNKCSLERQARFDEAGELRFGAYRGASRRNLEYVQEEGRAVRVYFTNGRPFIDLDLSGGTWRSTHLCGLDHYEITFSAMSDDVLEERWRVRGPMKDYEASTTLTRKCTAAPPLVVNPTRLHDNVKGGILRV